MQDNPQRHRFELAVEGETVFANYQRRGDVVAITHVEAPISLRGKGHADRLMREVAEDARHAGYKIQPLCGYASAWLRRHRDFADVVAAR